MAIYKAPLVASRPDVFLGGGISGATNWQEHASKTFSEAGFGVANPRREGDFSDPRDEPSQIAWENDHLERSNLIFFWMPGPGDHPIAMYELGRWINSSKPVVVGCSPQWKRRINLETQMMLHRPGLKIFYSLDLAIANSISILEEFCGE